MSRWGGGGSKCTVCTKTVYPAETIQYEKKPYHVECFKCTTCSKKMEGAAKASHFEDNLYCRNCFAKGGFAQKQKNVKWVKKESTGSAVASKFGGGGNPCQICTKTVYPAETVKFEKQIFHSECFKCSDCDTKVANTSKAAMFEGAVKCTKCFAEGGYRQKQAKSTGTKSTGSSNALASKFGGGGNPCTVCTKTVYPAETVSFEKKIFHSECFKCSDCDAKIANASKAALFEDAVKCTKCFSEGGYRSKQAATAKKGGTGSSAASARFSKFGGGGIKCVRCTKTVYPAEQLNYEKNAFHGACFTCLNCDRKLAPSGAEGQKQDDGSVKVYCKKCWGTLGLNRAQLKPSAATGDLEEEIEAAADEV